MIRTTFPLFAFALAATAPAVAQETIPVSTFRSVELAAGGDVSIVPGPVQRVTLVNGSRDFTRFEMLDNGKLRISTSCRNRCPHEYNLRIQIETPTVPDLAVEAGGTISVRPGFAPQRNVSAAVLAGGTINLRALSVESASAAIKAGGDIYVNARRNLNAAVFAGGDVRYSGNPQVSMAVANGGSVTRDR